MLGGREVTPSQWLRSGSALDDAGRSFDDLRNEVQAALDECRVALIQLVPVRLGDAVPAQPLRLIERMRHRRDAARVDRLELIDHRDDARQLRGHVGHFARGDLDASEQAETADVFWSQQADLDLNCADAAND